MTFKDWIQEHILPGIFWLFVHATGATLKIRAIGEQRAEKLRKNGEKLVYVFWHGRHFLLLYYMGNRGVSVMVSPSRDGLLISDVLRKSGFGIVQGSSDKSPVRALVTAIKQMKSGINIGFAVDGPKGPFQKVKPGALYLAKKMNAYIIPLTFSSKPCFMIKSWDRYMIPAPFSRAVLIFGEPCRMSADSDEATIQKECMNIENTLNSMTLRADRYMGRHCE